MKNAEGDEEDEKKQRSSNVHAARRQSKRDAESKDSGGYIRGAYLALEAELAALKEKYRWRRQSEEPAPEDEYVLIHYIDYDENDYYDIVKMEDMYDPDGELAYPLMWWRPLDLHKV